MRALVLRATPIDDNFVSACEETATTVLVCRTIPPFRPAHLTIGCISIFERLSSRVGLPAFRITSTQQMPLIHHIPAALRQGRAVGSCTVSPWQVSQVRLRAPAVCTHSHNHTRMRLNSEAWLSAPPVAWAVTASADGTKAAAGSVEYAPHREFAGSNSDF